MGWSCQKPARRALERDEQAIGVWKQRRWPALKTKPAGKGAQSSFATKGG